MPEARCQTRRAAAASWHSSQLIDRSTHSRRSPTPSRHTIGAICRTCSPVCATDWNRAFPVHARSSGSASTSRRPPGDRYNRPVRKKKVRATRARRPKVRGKKTQKTTARSLRSLAVTDAFRSFVLDQLGDVGDVTARSMFGGVGLYADGVFFGIVARDRLYLRVGDANRADYERAKMKPFAPYPGRTSSMRYYMVPTDVLESAPELAAWARRALAVAVAG